MLATDSKLFQLKSQGEKAYAVPPQAVLAPGVFPFLLTGWPPLEQRASPV